MMPLLIMQPTDMQDSTMPLQQAHKTVNGNRVHTIKHPAFSGIYIDSLVHENFSHRISRCRHRMPAKFLFFLPVTSQIVIRTAKFLQVFLATDNSLCQLFHCSAVNQSNDILCEYNVRTAGQLASRV